jgi:hypothetical protein
LVPSAYPSFFQLQQETRRLKTELNTAQAENERSAALVAELRQELAVLRARLDDTEWGLCHKSGELALIKAQLKDSQVSYCFTHLLIGFHPRIVISVIYFISTEIIKKEILC